MRLAAAQTALCLAAFCIPALCQVSDASADEDWQGRFAISAKKADGKVSITVQPKDGWYVNTEYALKLNLNEAASCEKSELTKDDAKFEGTDKPGKAKKATFSVKCTGAVEGKYKLVICSDDNCSPPIKGTFKG